MQKVKVLFNNLLLCLIAIVVITIPAVMPLTRSGFFPSQDEIYLVRMYEMDKAVKDGQFPVRWAPDLRYGEPLFNFYAPLPYYVASLIHTLNISFIDTAKILLALGFLLSGIAIFFLSREFFGNIGGLVSAVLYIYAPYHSVDVYVRGALSESLALIFFPVIFLVSLKLIQKPTLNKMLLLSLCLAGLFYTHNIMTILFSPFLLGWVIFLLWQNQDRNKNLAAVRYFIFSGLLGLGLAASFLLPALLEKNFTQADGMIRGYYDYRNHFVAFSQFFSTFWGYGASGWGLEDDMSFQVGLSHFAALFLSLIVAILNKKNSKIFFLILFLGLEFLFSLFIQHNKSTPIWTSIPILAFTQFPWRFLGISIFLLSFAGGSVGIYLKKYYSLAILVITVAVIMANINYFQPKFYKLTATDASFISLPAMFNGDNLPKDYLPIWVKSIADEKLTSPQAISGQIQVEDYKKKGTSVTFKLKVNKDADIEVPVTYFPGWKVFLDGKEYHQETPSNLGLVRFKVSEGTYTVILKFTDTSIRTIGNFISLFSLGIIMLLALKLRITKK